jgi:hypothetical protein
LSDVPASPHAKSKTLCNLVSLEANLSAARCSSGCHLLQRAKLSTTVCLSPRFLILAAESKALNNSNLFLYPSSHPSIWHNLHPAHWVVGSLETKGTCQTASTVGYPNGSGLDFFHPTFYGGNVVNNAQLWSLQIVLIHKHCVCDQ